MVPASNYCICRLKEENDWALRISNNTDQNIQPRNRSSRKEEMDYLKSMDIVPKWTKKNGIRRGDGWTEEGKERFGALLKLVKEDRKRDGSVEMDNRLLQYCQKTSEKKTARKRKRVTEPKKPAKRYDAMDSDNDSACDVPARRLTPV